MTVVHHGQPSGVLGKLLLVCSGFRFSFMANMLISGKVQLIKQGKLAGVFSNRA